MNHFTQYLYEYEQEKRIRNVGFVKMQPGRDCCALQIQGRGLEVRPDEELKVYLFYKRGEGCEAAYQGAAPKKNPIVSCTLEFSGEDIGNAGSVDDILGVLLLAPDGRRYAAVWGADAVNVGQICTEIRRDKEPAESETAEVSRRQQESETAEVSRRQQESETAEVSRRQQESETAEVSRRQQESETAEVRQGQRESETAEVRRRQQESETAEVRQRQPEEAGAQQRNVYRKIQRKDLAKLPRREWRLANNNFLLHGFYNYHHLLWLEENGELYIGVPGINHAREIQAAKAFGFTQFRHVCETDIELSDEESNPGEDFGYFCRRIIKNE